MPDCNYDLFKHVNITLDVKTRTEHRIRTDTQLANLILAAQSKREYYQNSKIIHIIIGRERKRNCTIIKGKSCFLQRIFQN